jgi:hypothetical protein
MNKRYVHYNILLTLLVINNASFSMGTNLVRYIAGSALVGGSYCGIKREISKYEETVLENVPCNVEKWARKNLIEKGIKNADSVPLKMNIWVTGRSFIGIDENEARELENYFVKQEINDEGRKKEIIAHEMLLHEAKHYHHNDFDKRYVMCGLISGILFLKNASVPGFFLKLAMVVGSNIAYVRHQELEADRFAFMNVPVEDLEVCKACRLEWAELFEEDALHKPFLNQKSLIGKSAGLLISKRLHQLNQTENNRWQKDILIGLADFCHDHEHPRYWRQVALVQECIDKRKE